MSLGEKIRRLREKRGIKQKRLANQANISQTHLSKIERGETKNPHLDTTKKILHALNVNPDRLVKYMLREFDSDEFLDFCNR